jgi:hypothetical protein
VIVEFPHRETPEGILVEVKVIPRSSRNELAGATDGVLRIKLTAPPVEGSANRQLLEFLAELLGVRKSDMEIVKGLSSRNKTIRIRRSRPAPHAITERTNP